MNDTKKLKIKYKDSISNLYPNIAKQWHPTKNGDLKPEHITPGSGLKVWWICNTKTECGCIHEYDSIVGNRCRIGTGCPYCAGHNICIHNSLLYKRPSISKMWHPTKNGDLSPGNVSPYSHLKVWWICIQGHENKSSIADKIGCPYCSNQKILSEKVIKEEKIIGNSIKNTNPELLQYWHPTKNGDLSPEDFVCGSTREKIWWKCNKKMECGCVHEYQSTPYNITKSLKKGFNGCPYCKKIKCCIHESFISTHPNIYKDWHPTKNTDINPLDLRFASNKKVWWKCNENNNHEWEAAIISRCRLGSGCPKCTYKTMKQLELYLSKHFKTIIYEHKPEWIRNRKTKMFWPFDIYIQDINLIIELDGRQHFKYVERFKNNVLSNKQRDVYKMLKAKENGIPNFIRILQEDVYNCSKEWLDMHLLTSLVPDAGVVFIHDEKHGDIYDEHYKLYMEGVIPDITDIGESDNERECSGD